VLIQGETGTGKEYLARAIHYLSDRAERSMVTLNCGGFPDELLENELFGHEKGAFTSANTAKAGLCEVADGGTLFLDEITHMSPAMQVKLLRFAEDHSFIRLGGTKPITVDVRLIAASNQPVNEMVKSGRFREDLYYRLNVIPLSLPPLRKRPEDIEVFTEHFMEQFNCGKDKQVGPKAWKKLHNHSWPGNLRELRNAVQRAVVLGAGTTIESEHLLLETGLATPEDVIGERVDMGESNSSLLSLEQVEKQHILTVLDACDNDREAAARILGISRATVDRRLTRYKETD
jgi:transcriptional regulator with PAS, ATPase and Fis domain